MGDNEAVLAGTIASIEPLRHTPAGVALAAFRLTHRSTQTEAGRPRTVECDVNAVALGDAAKQVAGLEAGDTVRVTGFLNRKSRLSTQLMLHVTRIERQTKRITEG